ncbi:MAG: LysR family transcriptional regulator [Comamonadaceae bacterium]|jgi:DNA-binding transcriptional LysR family regulator|nr:LysR family transcriptional regulator [Comamonadaceae bacterium]
MKLENLRGLKCFREIMALGSMTEAARSLGMSQPGMSRLLAALEAELGFKLFDRVNGRLQPNSRAQALYEEVDIALQGMERIGALAEDLQKLSAGHLRIVAPPTFAEGALVPVLADFQRLHPQLRISVLAHLRPTAMHMLAARAADCGIGKLPCEHPDIRVRGLLQTRVTCVLPPGHPLLAKPSLTPRDLADEPLILIGHSSTTRSRLLDVFRRHRVMPQARSETNNTSVACAMAEAGVGIALVDELLARNRRPDAAGFMRPLVPELSTEFGFLTARNAREDRTVEAFFAFYKSRLHPAEAMPAEH